MFFSSTSGSPRPLPLLVCILIPPTHCICNTSGSILCFSVLSQEFDSFGHTCLVSLSCSCPISMLNTFKVVASEDRREVLLLHWCGPCATRTGLGVSVTSGQSAKWMSKGLPSTQLPSKYFTVPDDESETYLLKFFSPNHRIDF